MPEPSENSSPHRRLSGLRPDALMAHGITSPTVAGAPGELVVPGCDMEAFLGRGGMGAVYLARQVNLDRDVAVKVLASELADDPLFLERIEREAKMMAKLRHSNIVEVHDFQRTENGGAAIVMQFVEGGSLRDHLQAHPNGLPVVEALRLIRQIASGLAAAHAAGIVHRDMKPENILIEQDGTARVTDFGLSLPIADETSRLTLSGTAVGTVDYMSPEQLRGGPVDARTDIFALGIILYELLTGQTPCGSFSPPHQGRNDIPEALSLVVMRALRPNPEDRFENFSEFLGGLEEKGGGRRRWFKVVLATVVLALSAGTALWYHSAKPLPPGPWINGLAGVHIYDDVVSGGWEKESYGVLTSNEGICIVGLEKEMPEYYDVRLRFTRLSGIYSVTLFFTADEALGCCDIDGWDEALSGVEMIGSKSLKDGYGFQFSIENGRSYDLLVEVRPGVVRVSIDGEFKKNFNIAEEAISVPHVWEWSPRDTDRFALGIGSYQSSTRFELVEWREYNE